MKKTLLLILFLAIAFTVHAQVETGEISYSKAGSTDLIVKQIQPLEQAKEINYDSLNMSYAGSWSLGQSFCIASCPEENLLFTGAGAGVIIYDDTDPYNLVKISEIHARALVDAIDYDPEWKWLYLSAYFSGLEVWDLSDAENPVRLSRAGTTGLPRGGIYAPAVPDIPGQWPYVYLVTVADGIDWFGISWSGVAEFMGNQNFTGSTLVWNSCGIGDTLFLAAGTTGTKAIALTNPMANVFNVPGNATSVCSIENLLCVLNSSSGMKIYDYSATPATMTGEISLTGLPYRLYLDGSLAVIANSTTNPGGGVNVVDIADPENPALVGEYAGGQTFITGREDASFSTGSSDGLVALNISDPTNPMLASSVELPVSTNDIAVRNDIAYMGNNGFRVFDVSDKSHPVQVGYHETDGTLVKLHGSYAVYCPESMGSSNRINIMDISDPENPQKLAHVTAPYMTNDLDIKGTYAYVACWWDGIRVVNFSDPENPTWGSHVMGWVNGATPGEEWLYCQALDVAGDYLYAVDYGPFPDEDTRGLYVFDISDPATPVLLKRFADFQGSAYDIEVSNGHAYIADQDGGLSIVSVEDPLAPIQTAYIALPDVAWAVDVFGPYAFVANYINGGVQVIDISIPSMPSVAGYYQRTGCFALNVTYNAGHVFVADGPAGMQIYNFDLLNRTAGNPTGELSVTVYPNPASDVVSFDLPHDAGATRVTLYDVNGRCRMQEWVQKPEQWQLHVAELPRGLYLLEMVIGIKKQSQKIILQ